MVFLIFKLFVAVSCICMGVLIRRYGMAAINRHNSSAFGTVMFHEKTDTSYTDQDGTRHTDIVYHPVVRFAGMDGISAMYQCPYSVDPSRYPVNSDVEVFYNPAEPGDFHLAGYAHDVCLWSNVMFVFAAVFLFACLFQ